MDIRREPLDSDVAQNLISALNAELERRYPEEGACHFRLDLEQVAPGKGAFLMAELGGRAVGCGALRRIGGEEGEIKRMFVREEARGRGIGRALLAALEEEARKLGVRRLLLETGRRQPEAIELYRKAGFVEIPPYGEYVGSALSVCMAKDLTAQPLGGISSVRS